MSGKTTILTVALCLWSFSALAASAPQIVTALLGNHPDRGGGDTLVAALRLKEPGVLLSSGA